MSSAYLKLLIFLLAILWGADSTIEKLGTQPQIVIGTPGRIKDLAINERVLLVHTAKMFVVDEAEAGIKIAGRNINNLRYADYTTLMAES